MTYIESGGQGKLTFDTVQAIAVMLANRFKDAKDSVRIVIVRDMWLTGFDAPCLHTMYADRATASCRPSPV